MLRFNIYSPNNEWKYIFKRNISWSMVCNWLEAIITSKHYAWHTTFHIFLYLYFSLKALTCMLFEGNYCLPLNIAERINNPHEAYHLPSRLILKIQSVFSLFRYHICMQKVSLYLSSQSRFCKEIKALGTSK